MNAYNTTITVDAKYKMLRNSTIKEKIQVDLNHVETFNKTVILLMVLQLINHDSNLRFHISRSSRLLSRLSDDRLASSLVYFKTMF